MLGCLAVALLGLPVAASASTVTVEAFNNQPMGGFSLTPVWLGFHDGSFDAFDAGSAASAGVETIAELGDPSVLDGEFNAAAPSGVSDVLFSPSGPPPFTPGQSNSTMIDVGDATSNRYFSFASMVIPSNDLFIGNDVPTAYEVFDAAGNFNGPITIELYGYNIWDAGTEVNDVNDGPAFVVGQDATAGTPEGEVIRVFFDTAGAMDYMASLDGVETPAYTLTDTLHRDELLGTIVLTPEPTSFVAFAVTGLVLAMRRRR
jgi:hypothetical protein